jgi:metal-responsive CopG/Arc/MetJ family transcriptional regulator
MMDIDIMKSIQITVDEALLETLDGDEEVRREGRSSVIRKALRRYLEEQRRRRIEDAYRRGYGTLGQSEEPEELLGWEEEQVWPEH